MLTFRTYPESTPIRERRAQRGDRSPIVVQEEHVETTSLHRVIRVVGDEDQGEVFTVYEGDYMTRVVPAGDDELGALLPPHCVLSLAPLAYLGAAEQMIHRPHREQASLTLPAGDGAAGGEPEGHTLPLFAQ